MKGKIIFLTIACTILFGGGNLFSSSSQTTTFYPIKTDQILHNPLMGWAPPADGGPYSQPHRLVYANLTWKELEPKEGQYAFEEIEKKYKFKDWADHGVKVILRIVMDYPREESHTDIPRWLYYKMNKDGKWYHNNYGQGFSPNYSNQLLIAAHQKLLVAMGRQYNDDPRIAFIQLGSLGHWGEWHTDVSLPFPLTGVSDQYVHHYLQAFPDKHLLMRRPHQIAKDYHLGLFNDMFGDPEHTQDYIDWFTNGYAFWLNQERHPSMPNFWMTSPSGGEFVGQDRMGLSYFKDSIFPNSLKYAKQTHISWLGPNAPVEYPVGGTLQKNLNEFLKTIGYRFRIISETHLKQLKRGSVMDISMTWENSGIAPFYYPWDLEFSLENKQGELVIRSQVKEDIQNWLPGTGNVVHQLQLPSNLPKGEYTLCIAILDPQTGEPAIKFAMEGNRGDLRYRLGAIKIE